MIPETNNNDAPLNDNDSPSAGIPLQVEPDLSHEFEGKRYPLMGGIAALYQEHGWVLTRIVEGRKCPSHYNWGHIETSGIDAHWEGSFGLLHGHSGTCAVDIDSLEHAKAFLAERGIDLDGLFAAPDAVVIQSGREDHDKLLYALPFGEASAKHVVVAQFPGDEKPKKHDVLNFRCLTGTGGTAMQDVLPPSMHPDGQRYRWAGAGNWRNLPPVPHELMAVWYELLRDGGGGASGKPRDGDSRQRETGDRDRDRAVEALSHIDPDLDREAWITIGMAFKSAGGELVDWDEWSSRGDKYQGPEDTDTRWASFDDDGGVGPGSLYHRAKEAGWVPPELRRPSIEEIFGGDPGDGPAGGVPPAPPMPADTVVAIGVARDLETLCKESSTEVVRDVVQRMARAGWDALDARRQLKAVAARTGAPIADLRVIYRKARPSRSNPIAEGADAFKAALNEPTPILQRLALAMVTLSDAPAARPHDFTSLASRYAWVLTEGKFFDRSARVLISESCLNSSYKHLGYNVSTGADLFVTGDGGTQGDAEEGAAPPPRAADVLLDSIVLAKVDRMDYLPGVEEPIYIEEGQLVLNTWRGGCLTPQVGDISPWTDLVSWLIPDPEERRYVVRWMAHCLRHQDRKINHNLLLGGKGRIGKDSMVLPLMWALGQSNTSTIQPDALLEPYQDAFVGRKLVVLNELHADGMDTRKIENKLKPFGAAPPDVIELRRFGAPSIRQRNAVQIVAFSNHRTAAALETSAERWYCVWCAPEVPKEQAVYSAYYQWLGAGGAEAVAWHLLHEVDLEGFEASAPAPSTRWRDQLVATTEYRNPVQSTIAEMINQGAVPFDGELVVLKEAVEAVRQEMAMDRLARVNDKTVTLAMSDLGCVRSPWFSTKVNKKVIRSGYWAIRNISFWSRTNQKDDWFDQRKKDLAEREGFAPPMPEK